MPDIMDFDDIYGDLDNFQAAEEQKSKELLALEAKYNEALSTIESFRAENAGLRKKIKTMEVNFQNLLDTAKAEIKRKDQQIAQLHKEKDDICFRRKKPIGAAAGAVHAQYGEDYNATAMSQSYTYSIPSSTAKQNEKSTIQLGTQTQTVELAERPARSRHFERKTDDERQSSSDSQRALSTSALRTQGGAIEFKEHAERSKTFERKERVHECRRDEERNSSHDRQERSRSRHRRDDRHEHRGKHYGDKSNDSKHDRRAREEKSDKSAERKDTFERRDDRKHTRRQTPEKHREHRDRRDEHYKQHSSRDRKEENRRDRNSNRDDKKVEPKKDTTGHALHSQKEDEREKSSHTKAYKSEIEPSLNQESAESNSNNNENYVAQQSSTQTEENTQKPPKDDKLVEEREQKISRKDISKNDELQKMQNNPTESSKITANKNINVVMETVVSVESISSNVKISENTTPDTDENSNTRVLQQLKTPNKEALFDSLFGQTPSSVESGTSSLLTNVVNLLQRSDESNISTITTVSDSEAKVQCVEIGTKQMVEQYFVPNAKPSANYELSSDSDAVHIPGLGDSLSPLKKPDFEFLVKPKDAIEIKDDMNEDGNKNFNLEQKPGTGLVKRIDVIDVNNDSDENETPGGYIVREVCVEDNKIEEIKDNNDDEKSGIVILEDIRLPVAFELSDNEHHATVQSEMVAVIAVDDNMLEEQINETDSLHENVTNREETSVNDKEKYIVEASEFPTDFCVEKTANNKLESNIIKSEDDLGKLAALDATELKVGNSARAEVGDKCTIKETESPINSDSAAATVELITNDIDEGTNGQHLKDLDTVEAMKSDAEVKDNNVAVGNLNENTVETQKRELKSITFAQMKNVDENKLCNEKMVENVECLQPGQSNCVNAENVMLKPIEKSEVTTKQANEKGTVESVFCSEKTGDESRVDLEKHEAEVEEGEIRDIQDVEQAGSIKVDQNDCSNQLNDDIISQLVTSAENAEDIDTEALKNINKNGLLTNNLAAETSLQLNEGGIETTSSVLDEETKDNYIDIMKASEISLIQTKKSQSKSEKHKNGEAKTEDDLLEQSLKTIDSISGHKKKPELVEMDANFIDTKSTSKISFVQAQKSKLNLDNHKNFETSADSCKFQEQSREEVANTVVVSLVGQNAKPVENVGRRTKKVEPVLVQRRKKLHKEVESTNTKLKEAASIDHDATDKHKLKVINDVNIEAEKTEKKTAVEKNLDCLNSTEKERGLLAIKKFKIPKIKKAGETTEKEAEKKVLVETKANKKPGKTMENGKAKNAVLGATENAVADCKPNIGNDKKAQVSVAKATTELGLTCAALEEQRERLMMQLRDIQMDVSSDEEPLAMFISKRKRKRNKMIIDDDENSDEACKQSSKVLKTSADVDKQILSAIPKNKETVAENQQQAELKSEPFEQRVELKSDIKEQLISDANMELERQTKTGKKSEIAHKVAVNKNAKMPLKESNKIDANLEAMLTITVPNSLKPSQEKIPLKSDIAAQLSVADNPPTFLSPLYSSNTSQDERYKEIDSRLESMFASPAHTVDALTSATQTPVAETHDFNVSDTCIADVSNNSLQLSDMTIDETNRLEHSASNLNETQSTLNDSNNSVCTRNISLGSSDYRLERVSENQINLFITRRKRGKKAAKAEG